MPHACDDLFKHALGFVTPGDIAAFAPGDPGYPNYIREFQNILTARSIPVRANFDITETVGLTRWANAEREPDPVRFRRFRVFTNAIALGMAALGRASDENFPPNYTLISLIHDASALQDSALWKLLCPAFEQAYEAWIQQCSEEAIFALLGLLLVNARLRSKDQLLTTLAERLIDEESRCTSRVTTVFVLGCTHYDQLHHLWRQHIADLIKTVSPSLSLIRDALLDGKPAGV